MTGPDPVEIAARIASALEGLGVRYLLGGSLASTAFGEPRATLDVDIAADLRAEQVQRFVAALEPEFDIDPTWGRGGGRTPRIVPDGAPCQHGASRRFRS